MDLNQFISECDSLIESGQLDAAVKRINAINTATIPRDLRLKIARLCRRAGMHTQGLKVLTPAVYPVKGIWSAENPEEIAVYAELLRGCGALPESLQILDKVNPHHFPEAYICRADCHIDQWNFKEAVIHLELYLGRADLTDSARSQAALKLAFCRLKMAELEAAASIASELAEAGSTPAPARAEALELRARTHIHGKRYQAARSDLETAVQLGLDFSRANKWLIIAGALETGALTELENFRSEATASKTWEDVRDADFFLLQAAFSEERFELLMFGTPYSSFRRVGQQIAGRTVSKTEYIFGDHESPAMDLITGRRTGGTLTEAPPRLVHRLINALMRDFYQPISTGALFSEVFPGEPFDVFSSIHRVHQAIHRTRKWLESQMIPVVIVETRGHYSLSIHGPFALRVPYERVTLDTEERRFQALAGHFRGSGFTARQARQALGMTPAVFKSLMSWAEEAGHIARMGAGPSTRYRIISWAESRSA